MAVTFCYIRPQDFAYSMYKFKTLLALTLLLVVGNAYAQVQPPQRLSPLITANETNICEGDEVTLTLAITEPTNTSVQFNGTNQLITFPASPAFDFGAATHFTVEFYMKQNGPGGLPQTLVSKGDAAGAGFAIGVNNGFINVGISDGANQINFAGFTNVSDNNWHHVAVAFDRNNEATIFVDGAFDANAGISSVGDIDNSDFLRVGVGIVNSVPAGFYNGFFDEFRVWSELLTTAEIVSRSQTHLNPASFPSLVGYWDFNDLSAPQVLDCSFTNATGTIQGGSTLPADAPNLAWTFSPRWSTGQTGDMTIFVTPADTTQYKVRIGYCKYMRQDSITINVEACEQPGPTDRISSIWVPNAFTPNGDNKNDVFLVQGSNIQSYEIMIYNRLGNIVYHSKNILSAWDGKLKDTEQKDDVYTYVISYRGYDRDGEEKTFHKYGTVAIIR